MKLVRLRAAAAFLLLILAGPFAAAQPAEPEPFPALPQGIDAQAVLAEAETRAGAWKGFEELEYAQMSRLGIRLVRGKHIELYTDLDESPEVDGIVPVLDEALPQLALYFQLDPARCSDWHIEAFLMSDREPFEIFGALKRAPDFKNGYALESRIWIYDQKQPYYNRFLLLHELTHAFMCRTFGDLNPRWYSEGIADYLALHRWDGKTLTLGIYPENPDEVPGFGRIDRIEKMGREKNRKTLDAVLDFDADDFRDNDSYAWSWALVTLLARSPRYAEALDAIPYLMMRRDANALFLEMLGEKSARLNRDWYEWIAGIGYGADFSGFARDDLPAEPFREPVELTLSPQTAGWQSAGIRLSAGKTYSIRAEGRFKVHLGDEGRSFPCEANGISLRYNQEAPLGQVSAAVPSEKPHAVNPWKNAVPFKSSQLKLTPETSGPLFFRFNIPSNAARKSAGSMTVKITEEH